jgi:hypothetical protein
MMTCAPQQGMAWPGAACGRRGAGQSLTHGRGLRVRVVRCSCRCRGCPGVVQWQPLQVPRRALAYDVVGRCTSR